MDPRILIAIPDLAGPTTLAATLAALAQHTPQPHEIVLLQESNESQPAIDLTQYAIRNTQHDSPSLLPALSVPAPFSAPQALNRLLAATTMPYLLLLESGALVTEGWLARLLASFADPTVGLAGPSTNLCWNEQQVARGEQVGTPDQIAAQMAADGARWAPLDTLHSLADFCYLFRRTVAEQLGGFDEAYGAGPCWEIDFNTRAARAGWQALWVADAYVHRAPPSPAHAQVIRRFFTTSKQLYQDRFCGLRLQGTKPGYEPHCRGEACPHFAPLDLIQVTLPGPTVSGQWSVVRGEISASMDSQASAPQVPTPNCPSGKPPTPNQDTPLVSCIMPTRNRRAFVGQAITYFQRQDYPARELIIVDDGDDPVGDLIPPADPRIRYLALPQALSIGEKRNRACELAQGAIIAHWDDDDWYGADRLARQVAPLLAGRTDLTGLQTGCFFDLPAWQAWTCTPALHRRLFVGDLHGGTLVYWRWLWERLARYPARSLAEDAMFLLQVSRQGARVEPLPAAGSFIYLRHAANAWTFPLGAYLDPAGWQRADPDAFLPPADRPFYAALSPAAPPEVRGMRYEVQDGQDQTVMFPLATSEPLVSCIMPTANRRAFVPQAITYFQRQDYPQRELIILDDGDEPVGDLVPADPRIRYVRLDRRLVLGAKRNQACALARGAIIAHWDDDDWIAPHRLGYQVALLEARQADLCGAGRQLYYDPRTEHAWLYEYPPQARRWLAGNTLCYRTAFWARNPFPEIAVGEDTRFCWSPQATNSAVTPDHDFYVGLVHPSNTSPKAVTSAYWRPHPVTDIYCLLGEDLPFYQALAR